MAENTLINPASAAGGDTIATDDLTTLNGVASSGIKAQRNKVCFGDDGDARDTSATYPLPVKDHASDLMVTATAAVNTACTLTLPAPAAGLFQYITDIEVVKLYSVIGIADPAGVVITSTNLPGDPSWLTEQAVGAAGTAPKVIKLTPRTPLKASVAATPVTIVCPQQLETIWRVNVTYFTAP
jgi:hypothetical protein